MSDECSRESSAERESSIHDGVNKPNPDDTAQPELKYVSEGCSGIVELIPPGKYVKKSTDPAEDLYWREAHAEQIIREIQIYKMLQEHDDKHFIKMIDYSENGLESYIILEYLPIGDLDNYLQSDAESGAPTKITYDQQLQWSVQMAEGIAILHSLGVIHSDIKPRNMLLDNDLCVRIIDLAGSAYKDLSPLCFEAPQYSLPRDFEAPIPSNTTSDIFALGSSIYHVMKRAAPYNEIDRDDIPEKFAQKIFPDVTNVPCGDIILKCWLGEYTSADMVVSALKCRLRKETPSVWSVFYKGLSTVLPFFGFWYRKAMLALTTFVGRPIFSHVSK